MPNYEKLTKAGIDLDALKNRLMGNTSLIKLFVSKFVADATYTMLLEAFTEQDMQKAERASHTLKGMCGNMSMEPHFARFTEQVDLIRHGKYDAAEAMMVELSTLYTDSITLMREWLAEQ